MNMSFLLGLAAVMVLVVLILMFRVQGLLSIVRGSDKRPGGMLNKFNGAMFLLFTVLGTLIFVYYSFSRFNEYSLPEAVSEHGIKTDNLFWVTTVLISIVFIVVNGALMLFAFKYQYKEGNKAKFYPDNHVLELVWTIIPAIVLTYLVFNGWKVWSNTMSDPVPQLVEDRIELEVVGQQFYWNVRYPGCDDKLGAHYFKNIDAENTFGLKVTDQNSWDDFMPRQIFLAKGRKVHFVIRAKDVLHSVYLPHFRVKMDAMPGMPTEFWFTPTKTTQEMRNELDDQTFTYEMACTEMCGKGHYSMRYEVVVLENDDYEEWLKTSCKSSWALEKGDYVLNQLSLQGAPNSTVIDFLKFMSEKDKIKAEEVVGAYLTNLKKSDVDNNTDKLSVFINAVSKADSKIGSWLKGINSSNSSVGMLNEQSTKIDSNMALLDTSKSDGMLVDEEHKNILQKAGDAVEIHKEKKAEKNGEVYQPKENVLHKAGDKF